MSSDSGTGQSSYSWYGVVTDGTLEQGDILDAFPVVVPFSAPEVLLESPHELTVSIRTMDVIVLTQSCDLTAKKVENVVICPIFEPAKLEAQFNDLLSKKGKDRIRAGAIPSLHVLPPCSLEGYVRDVRIANFRQIATSPFEVVSLFADRNRRRMRLLPPYREKLAQACAHFLSRIGLPQDYPTF